MFVVVDDDPRIRASLKAEFDDLGISSCFFDNAFDLIDYVAEETVSGVFVDLLLPQMSGIECIKRLRLMGHEGPVFVFTGLCDSAIKQEVIEAGANDYFLKSDLFFELAGIVARCLAE
jgi:FixJ family two-component response regulator|tara:strand:+ start:285 stop:638 length:354 start_codon:yes stop_codon:yes gene_type:complete